MRIPFNRLLAPAVLLLALGACSDEPSAPQANISFADRSALETMGFSGRSAVDHGDYYLVEGDIVIAKADLRAGRVAPPADVRAIFRGNARATANLPGFGAAGSRPGGPRFQSYTNTLASASRVRNIKVNLNALSGQPAWLAAARAALTHWTSIDGSAVTMVESATSPDITISIANLNNTAVIAQATWPKDATGGGPGPTITINSQNLSISDSWKENTVTHELGHTIGLRHTNWAANGETAGTLGAILVQGTTTSDANSVMQAVVHNWAGFTAGDERAAITLYGDTTQLSISYTGGGNVVSWPAIPGAVSYNLNIMWVGNEYYTDPNDRDNSYGTTVYDGQNIATTTGTSYTDTTYPYTGSSNCFRYAMPNDPAWSGGYYTSYYWLQANFANGETHSHAVSLNCA